MEGEKIKVGLRSLRIPIFAEFLVKLIISTNISIHGH